MKTYYLNIATYKSITVYADSFEVSGCSLFFYLNHEITLSAYYGDIYSVEIQKAEGKYETIWENKRKV